MVWDWLRERGSHPYTVGMRYHRAIVKLLVTAGSNVYKDLAQKPQDKELIDKANAIDKLINDHIDKAGLYKALRKISF
jgi:hypothetical protein